VSGQVCHEHCPPTGGSLGVIVGAVVAVGGTGATIAAYLNDIVLVSGITAAVLAVAGIWFLVHVLRRDRFVTHKAEIMSQAEVGESRLLAFDGAAPAGRRLNEALVAQQRYGLPDGAQRKPVLRGEVTFSGEPARVRPVSDQRPEDRR